MKRHKNKQTFESLRMTQDGKSNPFFWQGFLKDFRFVSPLGRQMNKMFEEASLSHGVRAIWNFVVRIVFCIACSLFKLSLRQVVSVSHQLVCVFQ